ncbi:MAG: lipid-A-disaccharide synthase [Pseudomonadales bacterium]
MQTKPFTVALLAGEASGDLLGAGLMQALQTLRPNVQFIGIGGDKMQACGLNSMAAMERLSVMGLFEPLKRLPELLHIRREFLRQMLACKPAVFIGIDSPDFNLPIAGKLHAAGIKTVHYVSPSVWAWRQNRVHRIKRSLDLMLTLFPFESTFYQQHAVPVAFVGHPLADTIPLQNDTLAARAALPFELADNSLIAVLPGSRRGEVAALLPAFLDTIRYCAERRADLQFIIPAANAALYAFIAAQLRQQLVAAPIKQRIHLSLAGGQRAMAAADAVLMASGTTTLEALLLKKPMVVAYKLSALTYLIVKRMIKLDNFSLPNLLAGDALVPEYVQLDVRADRLGPALLEQLDERARESITEKFTAIHRQLRQNASRQAAVAILKLLDDAGDTTTGHAND